MPRPSSQVAKRIQIWKLWRRVPGWVVEREARCWSSTAGVGMFSSAKAARITPGRSPGGSDSSR